MTAAPSCSRRRLLRGAATAGAALLAPWAQLSLAAGIGSSDRKLVLVLLRGGLDGLAAVPVPGDPGFAAARGVLGEYAHPLLPLEGPFALHPNLTALHALYGAGQAVIVHAAGLPYRERSHFDAQQLLESGGSRPYELTTGWLGRALEATGQRGVALNTAVPLVLRGGQAIDSWAPSVLPEPAPDLVQRLAALYQHDPQLATALERARRLREEGAMASLSAASAAPGMSPTMAPGMAPAVPPVANRGQAVLLARKAAELMLRPAGAQVAVLEMGGWDTHANQAAQGNTQGALANNLRQLDTVLATLREALEAPAAAGAWQRTVVVVTSEFGREVAANGTNGSDHGTGGIAFVVGGAVQGGRVIADWPGLAPAQRFEGRDLRITTDIRSLLRPLLQAQLGVPRDRLDRLVLPGSSNLRDMVLLRG